MGVDGAGVAVVVVVPDVVQDFFSGEGDSLVFEEVGEEFEFFIA